MLNYQRIDVGGERLLGGEALGVGDHGVGEP
jgi:hypothetical protein